MDKKGINTTITDAKSQLVEVINNALQSGIPIAVVDMMLDMVSAEVKTVLQSHLKAEGDALSAVVAPDIGVQPSSVTEG